MAGWRVLARSQSAGHRLPRSIRLVLLGLLWVVSHLCCWPFVGNSHSSRCRRAGCVPVFGLPLALFPSEVIWLRILLTRERVETNHPWICLIASLFSWSGVGPRSSNNLLGPPKSSWCSLHRACRIPWLSSTDFLGQRGICVVWPLGLTKLPILLSRR